MRVRRGASAVVVAALVAALAACGSNLDPDEVGLADGGTVAQNGTVTDPDTGVVTDPGTGEVVDPGTGEIVDPGTGTTDPGTGTTDPGTGTTDPGTGTTDPGEPSTEAPVDASAAGSCDGFKNGPGITDSAITIGNASDISGPVPGLFETAQVATKAFVTYFNATVPDGICGRKLELKNYDSRTDAAADQQAYASACTEVFAMVGSQSAFDSGGAKTAQNCGLPDMRASSVTTERSNGCSTCFGVQAVDIDSFENAVPDFVKKYGTSAAQNAAFFYINAGASSQNALAQVRAMERRGLKFTVVQPVDIAEFNYAPFVQQLKDKKVETVFWTGAYQQSARLRQAMQQNGYEPKLYLRDPTDYNPAYVSQGGSAVDKTVIFMNFTPFEEARSNRELATYLSYLDQVKPGATPEFFGVFGWSATKLFVELATKLGGALSRETLLAEVRKVDDWTAAGMHAPQPVGPRGTGECWRFIQLDGTVWKPVGGTKYTCNGLTSSK
ncbi:MAG: ABC transporter substrate-binding protein [Nocardioides sp.]